MTMTCASLMSCMMTMHWSTPSRQRMMCLRSWTSFTVSSVYEHHSSFLGMLRDWNHNLHTVLAGRTPEASADLQQKFTQFSLETGILADNIAILPKNGTLAAKRNPHHKSIMIDSVSASHIFSCASLQLSVPRPEESHPSLIKLGHLGQWNQPFYSNPCCIPKTSLDPVAQTLPYPTCTLTKASERKNKGATVRGIKGRGWKLLVSFATADFYCSV